ncbi:MAG: hypothetical protein QOD71_2491 [Thermoleophilaceae bacterium]|nr:hypothetical protein [Thermoleophilaceae bacterium]
MPERLNGAVSKTVDGRKVVRGFESLPLRCGKVLAVARSQRRAAKATDVLIIATAAATARKLHTLDAGQARRAEAAGVTATVL